MSEAFTAERSVIWAGMRAFLEIPGKVGDLAKAILTLAQFEHNLVS